MPQRLLKVVEDYLSTASFPTQSTEIAPSSEITSTSKERLDPKCDIVEEKLQLQRQIEELKIQFNQHQQNSILELQKDMPTTQPNLDIATVPQSLHTEISGIDARHFRMMQEKDSMTLYCIILVDGSNPETPEILSQFIACTKGFDIRRNYLDIKTINDPIILKQIEGHELPIIIVGRGLSSEIVPFGKEGDDNRLLSIILGYMKPRIPNRPEACPASETSSEVHSAESNPITLRDKKVEIKKDQGENNVLQESTSSINADQENLESNEQNTMAQGKNGELERPVPLPNISSENIESSKHLAPVVSMNTSLLRSKEKLMMKLHLPFFKPGSVMIDGSNLAYLYKDNKVIKGPSIRCIDAVVNTILSYGIPRNLIAIYFDANFRHKLEEENASELSEYLKRIAECQFREVPTKTEADTALIQGGRKLGQFIIVTNDGFRKKPDWIKPHRVGVGLHLPDNEPYLAVDSIEDLISAFYGKKYRPEEQMIKLGGEGND